MRDATIGIVLDCAHPESLADFWTAALGLERVGADGEYVLLSSSTGRLPKLLLQRVAEPKTTKNRMHIDIEVEDIDAEVRRLERLGARRLENELRREVGSQWLVMTDPEGNEFCVCNYGDLAGSNVESPGT